MLLRFGYFHWFGGFMRHTLLIVACVVAGLGYSTVSAAQTTDAATEQRISALEARVSALEHRQAQAAAPEQAPAATSTYSAAQPTMAPAAAVAAAPVVVRAPPTAADWGSLHRGMTGSQVRELLGKPGDTRVLPASSTWYYPDIHGRSIEFDRNNRVEQWSQP